MADGRLGYVQLPRRSRKRTCLRESHKSAQLPGIQGSVHAATRLVRFNARFLSAYLEQMASQTLQLQA
jgi:hypothetical protein